MKYLDGRDILLGDNVALGGNMTGIIVCCFDEGNYMPEFPRKEWAALGKGVLVNSDQAGLIHYSEPEADLALISRAGP